MEEQLSDLYHSLPPMRRDLLYLPGYTEALEYVEGVKIFPSYDFMELVPFKFKRFFEVMDLPCYYIPIRMQLKHFGFLLKGIGKKTSRFSTYYPYFNMEDLLSPKPYIFVVEGVKDAGLFLFREEPVMSILTSGMAEEMTKIFKEYGKVPIFVQDNDSAGDTGMKQMLFHLRKQGTLFLHVKPRGHKDMGDYFDHPELRSVIECTYKVAMSFAQSLGVGSTLGRPTTDGLGIRRHGI